MSEQAGAAAEIAQLEARLEALACEEAGLPTIVPGDRLWLAADVPTEARVYVVGLDSRNTFTPLGHWPARGDRASPTRGESAATEIVLGPRREVPSTVLVIASVGILKVLEGEDLVACEGNPASTRETCEQLRALASRAPPRPRCCVPPDLDVVSAGSRMLPARKARSSSESPVVVEFQFRSPEAKASSRHEAAATLDPASPLARAKAWRADSAALLETGRPDDAWTAALHGIESLGSQHTPPERNDDTILKLAAAEVLHRKGAVRDAAVGALRVLDSRIRMFDDLHRVDAKQPP